MLMLVVVLLLGCSAVDKAEKNVKEEIAGYQLSVVNTGSGYVYQEDGKLYYKPNDYVEAIEIEPKDVVKYGGKILLK